MPSCTSLVSLTKTGGDRALSLRYADLNGGSPRNLAAVGELTT
jgi:hypothetical protein